MQKLQHPLSNRKYKRKETLIDRLCLDFLENMEEKQILDEKRRAIINKLDKLSNNQTKKRGTVHTNGKNLGATIIRIQKSEYKSTRNQNRVTQLLKEFPKLKRFFIVKYYEKTSELEKEMNNPTSNDLKKAFKKLTQHRFISQYQPQISIQELTNIQD